jgi:hypothetical protein
MLSIPALSGQVNRHSALTIIVIEDSPVIIEVGVKMERGIRRENGEAGWKPI